MKRWRWGDPLDAIRDHLARSRILFIPSESSYGIAVDPRNPKGAAAVYSLKERDAGKPLLVVVDGVERLEQLTVDPDQPAVRRLAERVWPAPVTVVLPTRERIAAGGSTGSIAVRVPAHAALRNLIRQLDMPLTATSANLSGASPVLEPRELEELFPTVEGLIVEDGRLPGGPPSTLIRPGKDGWHLLRVGGLSRSRLQELLEEPVIDDRELP